jgi:hypothetical protein
MEHQVPQAREGGPLGTWGHHYTVTRHKRALGNKAIPRDKQEGQQAKPQ